MKTIQPGKLIIGLLATGLVGAALFQTSKAEAAVQTAGIAATDVTLEALTDNDSFLSTEVSHHRRRFHRRGFGRRRFRRHFHAHPTPQPIQEDLYL